MKSFGSYISKYLVSFVAFILILLFLNAVVFGLTFQKIVTEDYGDSSPQAMLEMTATAATPEQLSDEAVQMLRQNHIWAIYLNTDGQCYWSVDLPDNVPKNYTIQDVALFSKGYIEDYPVFIWNTDDGLLVLGYPTDSYTKLTSNYYSIAALQRLPIFVLGMLGLDLLCLFSAYYFSKRRIIHNTEPIVSAVETLADGKPDRTPKLSASYPPGSMSSVHPLYKAHLYQQIYIMEGIFQHLPVNLPIFSNYILH